MMDEVADSTDWLSTPLSGLAPLESGLRCQVCKDFFTTPMMTSCSHTFCSLCIRRYLSQEGRCPACRESDQEMKLRRNWAVEELVSHFTSARAAILKVARKPEKVVAVADRREEGRPRKRRKVEAVDVSTNSSGGSTTVGRRSTRSQSKRVATSASQASHEFEAMSTQEEIADSAEEGSVYDDRGDIQSHQEFTTQTDDAGNKPKHDGLVECPCCTRRIKEISINSHLDRCIQGLPTTPEPPTLPIGPPQVHPQPQSNVNNTSLAFAQRPKSPSVTAAKERLPSINYALYTETSLRKKLKELGIPNQGSKELMRKRHTEWMNLWNANCDARRPRQKRELLKDLETWERTLGRQFEKAAAAGGVSGIMVKDFDRDGWAKEHTDDFDNLIRKAREKRKPVVAGSGGNEETLEEGKDMPMKNSVPESDQDPKNNDSGTRQNGAEQTEIGVTEENGVTTLDHGPQTPQKLKNGIRDHGTPVDLTSSPVVSIAAVGISGEHATLTPGKHSRFFS